MEEIALIAAGALMGGFIAHSIKSVKIMPVNPPDRTGRLAGPRSLLAQAMFLRAAGWYNRTMVAAGVFALSVIDPTHWSAVFPIVVWFLILNMGLSNATHNGWRAGQLEQVVDENLIEMSKIMRETFELGVAHKQSVAMIDVSELMRIADTYGVPPQEVETLVWGNGID